MEALSKVEKEISNLYKIVGENKEGQESIGRLRVAFFEHIREELSWGDVLSIIDEEIKKIREEREELANEDDDENDGDEVNTLWDTEQGMEKIRYRIKKEAEEFANKILNTIQKEKNNE